MGDDAVPLATGTASLEGYKNSRILFLRTNLYIYLLANINFSE